MSRRVTPAATRKSGRSKSLLWIGGMAIVIILLLYFEQTALLYVISTLGLTVLLVVVAISDLHDERRVAPAAAPADDAAAIGTGIASTLPAGSAPRASKRK
jgi:hypothetical protein